MIKHAFPSRGVFLVYCISGANSALNCSVLDARVDSKVS